MKLLQIKRKEAVAIIMKIIDYFTKTTTFLKTAVKDQTAVF
ncbi:hypothetical protein [Spiroplasma endosymbiont of Sarcophaga variegata]